MDQRAVHVLEVKKGDNIYTFSMPHNGSIGEAYDAMLECFSELVRQAQENVKKMKRKEEDKEKEKVSESK